ncbi:chemosensory receptor c [Plakobranchus ocellatus]|uniref:Chemosensory receptor c n=1 Tax=Plakobranchus ocellatus TaxID=259542 RepID=A0AAV4D699_9GAST|nr:chemosensory receptor c [Plakobranchus ocellatus]
MDVTPISNAMDQVEQATATYLVIVGYILMITGVVVGVAAVVLNLTNTVVFLSLGLMDSSTVCFFSLSLSDFFTGLFMIGFVVIDIVQNLAQMDLFAFEYFLIHFFVTSTETSAAITTYIALQRALCVALPFYTRHAFTRRKSALLISAVFVLHFASNMAWASTSRITLEENNATNSTRYVLSVGEIREKATNYIIILKACVMFLEQIVMIICIVVLVIGLRTSRQLIARSRPATRTPRVDTNPGISIPSTGCNSLARPSRVHSSPTKQGKRENKESKAIQQCLVIVITHVILTILRSIIRTVLAFSLFSEGSDQIAYLSDFGFIIDCLNAAVQFFIYMKFNTKYQNFVCLKLGLN